MGKESLLGGTVVFLAIGWAVIFGYVLLLLNSQRRLRWEIDSLKETFEKKGDTL